MNGFSRGKRFREGGIPKKWNDRYPNLNDHVIEEVYLLGESTRVTIINFCLFFVPLIEIVNQQRKTAKRAVFII